MNATVIERHFARIGARAQISVGLVNRNRGDLSVNVLTDRRGEYFTLSVRAEQEVELSVVDVRPRERHLLLMAEDRQGKHKFLCGHDERHWFVAATPEKESVSSVATAMEALKPTEVRHELVRRHVKSRRRNRRRNEAFIRQGEWFFVPARRLVRPNEKLILRREPLRRGGGKPHIVDELVRIGGTTVYVSTPYPNGLTESEYTALLSEQPDLRRQRWLVMRRDPEVYVRGKVRHADHKTISLEDWHRVLMNTETQSAAMQHVAFLD